jgi:hypothetical protein
LPSLNVNDDDGISGHIQHTQAPLTGEEELLEQAAFGALSVTANVTVKYGGGDDDAETTARGICKI